MTRRRNETQLSPWTRLGRELVSGMHAMGWVTGMPMHPALLTLWEARTASPPRRRPRSAR